MSIYIVRHGQDEDNANGILNGHRNKPLTEKGMIQATQLSEKLLELQLPITHILSSPLKRAFQTAQIVSKKIDKGDVLKEHLLIERDFGIMSGKKIADVESMCKPDLFKTETITYFLSPEGAETFPDLIMRAKELLIKLEQLYSTENVLLVTHGDMGKMIYAAFYNEEWQDVLKHFHFGNSELIVLDKDVPVEQRHVVKIEQHNS